jgi:hypothetical protein
MATSSSSSTPGGDSERLSDEGARDSCVELVFLSRFVPMTTFYHELCTHWKLFAP